MQFWSGLFNMLIEVKEIIKHNEISHSCKSNYAHNMLKSSALSAAAHHFGIAF